MIVDLGTQLSDSPFVQTVYRARSVGGGSFLSTAASNWEMVITKQKGRVTLSIRGPETKVSPAPIPEDAEFLGVIFKHGAFMPSLPVSRFVDKEIHLPETVKNSFQLFGDTWEFPTFDNIDTFVDKLTREDLLTHDPVVEDVLRGKTQDLSLRSVQRRFLQVTGLSYKTIQQIERAKQAASLLQSGVPISDTTYQTGYFDQAHLTNSLRRYYGQTPTQIIQSANSA
ncbi:MAG: helix-turn-helix transcriptional regulator [Anaerolineales bacterium]|nr:helix-turn-helix transcriptional regulator [Anaerolineales bacterium]